MSGRVQAVFVAGVLSTVLAPCALSAAFFVEPLNDLADGVEVADSLWLPDGVPELDHTLTMGYWMDPSCIEPALMFPVCFLARGDSITFARMRMTSRGTNVTDSLRMEIRGLRHCTDETFHQDFRPSQIATVAARVPWTIIEPWPDVGYWNPYFVFSPDIAPIINEILSLDIWPEEASPNACVALSIDLLETYMGGPELGRAADTGSYYPTVRLEIYRTMDDAFQAPPMPGRLTDSTATVSFAHFLPLDCYIAYGDQPGNYCWAQGVSLTALPAIDPILATAAGGITAVDLAGLAPNTRYYYSLAYRRAGVGPYLSAAEGTFCTQRARSETFSFSVMSDSHLENYYDWHTAEAVELYRIALENLANDDSDFHINLGDFALTRYFGYCVHDLREAQRTYADQRWIMGSVSSSVPFYLVLGNHEGEAGWTDEGGDEEPFAWSTRARHEFCPNPRPGDFYAGNEEEDPRFGLIENYYAWEWGDALFVVLDPFRTTSTKPHNWMGAGSNDGWDWTLGETQYRWLAEVLSTTDCRWRFVFIHHLVGGVVEPTWGPYGRGGIEAVRHAVAGRPTFEWGGEEADGTYSFPYRRPGWDHGDIHSLLDQHDVTIVFHGHDHCYVMQDLDGIVYQECPTPTDHGYGYGFHYEGGYVNGISRCNSGHLRVTVSPADVCVEYVRAYLPDTGENGIVEYTYRISELAGVGEPRGPLWTRQIRLASTPCRGRSLWVCCHRPWHGPARLALYDTEGRILSTLSLPESPHAGECVRWDLDGSWGHGPASGVYHARLDCSGGTEWHRCLFVR